MSNYGMKSTLLKRILNFNDMQVIESNRNILTFNENMQSKVTNFLAVFEVVGGVECLLIPSSNPKQSGSNQRHMALKHVTSMHCQKKVWWISLFVTDDAHAKLYAT